MPAFQIVSEIGVLQTLTDRCYDRDPEQSELGTHLYFRMKIKLTIRMIMFFLMGKIIRHCEILHKNHRTRIGKK